MISPASNRSPVLVEDGVVVGTWSHSRAVGRLGDPPVAHLWGRTPTDRVEDALERYRTFLIG